MKSGETKPVTILLIEDNPADVRLTQVALKEAEIENRMDVVGDGVAAIEYLRRQGNHTGAPRPDLILLDLNLPKKDGREVLAEIKQDRDLRTIPVVVLTTSRDDEDVLRSYQLHANCYVNKPVDLEQFLRTMKSIKDFWLTVVKLPVPPAGGSAHSS